MAAATVLAVLAFPHVAAAALAQQTGSVDLLGQANLQIDGASAGNAAGTSVAAAGDVNGDGYGDLVVGAWGVYDSVRRLPRQGTAYVVFGQPGLPARSVLEMGALGSRGFAIVGATTYALAGYSVDGAGDVNGDSLDDLVIGAPESDPADPGTKAGSAWVVYGKRDTAKVYLDALYSGGFRIAGAAGDRVGLSVSGAGDVNADSHADVIVGAPFADNGATDAGAAYVVFGKAGGGDVDLANLGVGGFGIAGAATRDETGHSVAGVGDVNGDQRPDIVVGAPKAGANGRVESGSAYVVFGRASTSTVALATLGTDGYRIDGSASGDLAGSSVAGAGDVSGDGLADVVVGAPLAAANGQVNSGSAFVVPGRRGSNASVDLRAPLSGGFRIDGGAPNDQLGFSVGGPGDVNGDGRPDVVAGSLSSSGSATVAFGTTDVEPIDAAAPGARGYRIAGAAAGAQPGTSVAAAGDVNADGRPDLVVGAPEADNSGGTNAGAAYVLFGFAATSLSYPLIAGRLGQPISPVAPSAVKRTGVAAFAATALPAGLTVDAASGVISGTPTVAGEMTSEIAMTDLAGTASFKQPIVVTGPIVTAFKPVNTTRPRITGSAVRGKRLTCARGTWAGTEPIDYATTWRRGSRVVDKAVRHTVVKSDVARTLTCRVTAKNAAGTATATSKAVVLLYVTGSITDDDGTPRPRKLCVGEITLTLKHKKRTIARHTVKVSRTCRWEWTFKLDRAKLGGARRLRLKLRRGGGSHNHYNRFHPKPVPVRRS